MRSQNFDGTSQFYIRLATGYGAMVAGDFNGDGVDDIVGLIEGVAEATASLLKLFSGWFSDRVGGRKWVAVTGYAISAFSKPFYYFAGSARIVASVRWADRVGKGIRTAPRDALVADSVAPEQRGIAFGFHRAADTAGAVVGLLIALLVVWFTQSGALSLDKSTFQTLVLISLIPAFMGVLALVVMARDVPVMEQRAAPKFRLKGLGRPFLTFLFINNVSFGSFRRNCGNNDLSYIARGSLQ